MLKKVIIEIALESVFKRRIRLLPSDADGGVSAVWRCTTAAGWSTAMLLMLLLVLVAVLLNTCS